MAVDYYATVIGGREATEAVLRSPALLGFESDNAEPPESSEVAFVDWPFDKVDGSNSESLWHQHLSMVEKYEPRLTVAPDLEGDTERADVLDHAEELVDAGADEVVAVSESVDAEGTVADEATETVVLVGCGAAKRDGVHPARDLYTSTYFAKKCAYAEQADRWYVLSAEHGVIDPEEQIEQYDREASDLEPAELQELVGTTLPDDLDSARVEILAGKDYYEPALPVIENQAAEAEVPTRGLGIGEQMAWLDNHAPEEPAAGAQSDPAPSHDSEDSDDDGDAPAGFTADEWEQMDDAERAYHVHAQRSPEAQIADEAKQANQQVDSFEGWVSDPNRVDFQGVDSLGGVAAAFTPTDNSEVEATADGGIYDPTQE